ERWELEVLMAVERTFARPLAMVCSFRRTTRDFERRQLQKDYRRSGAGVSGGFPEIIFPRRGS
ncbi:hypothetical protein, partial [Corallococcus interemptor]|uniref:hypothetical protein n=1 Tax=Corallococcus interemptor TaxID=2316720 RepID=UPI001ABFB378